jgi:hypothetical protein
MTDSSTPEHPQVSVRKPGDRFSRRRAHLDALLAIVISVVLGLMTINKLQSVRLGTKLIAA